MQHAAGLKEGERNETPNETIGSNCRGRGDRLVLVHQRGGNDGRNDSRLNHAGDRYKRCNQHTGRSASALAARVSGSSALAGAALAWGTRTLRHLVRRLLIGSGSWRTPD